MNAEKSEVLLSKRKRVVSGNKRNYWGGVETDGTFKYLGSEMETNGRMLETVKEKLKAVWTKRRKVIGTILAQKSQEN